MYLKSLGIFENLTLIRNSLNFFENVFKKNRNIFKMPRILKKKPRILKKEPRGSCRIATMASPPLNEGMSNRKL
jgi:hypothetical protein